MHLFVTKHSFVALHSVGIHVTCTLEGSKRGIKSVAQLQRLSFACNPLQSSHVLALTIKRGVSLGNSINRSVVSVAR